MSSLIEGMEMPKEGFIEIIIRDDGTVQQTGQSYRIDGTDYYTPYVGEMPTMFEAVEIPPHGRLGDLDKLEQMFVDIDNAPYSGFDGTEPFYSAEDAAQIIRLTPTVIPADKDGET